MSENKESMDGVPAGCEVQELRKVLPAGDLSLREAARKKREREESELDGVQG